MKTSLLLVVVVLFGLQGKGQKTEIEHYKPLLDSFPFEKYKVDEIYNGEIAKLDLGYYSDSPKDIREIILYHYNQEKKPNFAGHYIIIEWSCGSPCQMNAIVDAINGKTITTFSTSWGTQFRVDSYLLIQNPPTTDIYDRAHREMLGEPEIDLFRNNNLVVLRKSGNAK
jgi:hypothetical protein